MNEKIKRLVKDATKSLIESAADPRKCSEISDRHSDKIHFVPFRYRVLGGLLQSLNIRFGNYIETLIHMIVQEESALKIEEDVSGRKIALGISEETDSLIDKYISERQTPGAKDLVGSFRKLLGDIVAIEAKAKHRNENKHDVDVLFRTKSDGKAYYLEVKYNDDHDTGKYVDINRKFIKTYAGLVSKLGIHSVNELTPILYYLNNKTMTGNIYVPEETNIRRGPSLFKQFFSIDYNELDAYLKSIGDDEEILKIFDDLYQRVRNGPIG
jgi:hypothetical protein